MRPKFRETLETYGAIAKDKMKKDFTPTDLLKLDHVLDWNIKQAADRRKSTAESQTAIHEMQVLKQKIMKRLKEDIKLLDNPDYRPEKLPTERSVVYESDSFWYIDENHAAGLLI